MSDGDDIQFSEMTFSLPEFIAFARGNGDEETAREYELYYRLRGDSAYVRMLVPNDPGLHGVLELVIEDNE